VGTSLVPSYSQGNVNVKAEIGNTLTAGVVWKPAPRLSFAVDGYRIKITNAIQNFSGFTPALQDTCYASGGTSNFCQLQSRPINYTDTSAANLVTAWYQTPINIAEMESWGADFEANFATTIAGRAFSLRALATWQPHIYIRVPTQVTLDAAGSAFGPNGGIASPKLRVTAFMRYAVTNNVTIDVMERWRSAMQHSTDTTQVWIDNHVPALRRPISTSAGTFRTASLKRRSSL